MFTPETPPARNTAAMVYIRVTSANAMMDGRNNAAQAASLTRTDLTTLISILLVFHAEKNNTTVSVRRADLIRLG
jgi:hypothetical protein